MFEIKVPHLNVSDTAASFADDPPFDLIVVAAGYEPRCTHVLTSLVERGDRALIGRRTLLLQFGEHQELRSRRASDAFFESVSPRWRLPVTKQSGLAVVRAIKEKLSGAGARRILVDYTSMSRFLYLTLIELAKYDEDVELTFAYSVGNYGVAATNYPVSKVGNVRPVPGLEGLPLAGRSRLYVFGLGYDGLGTGALVERLEAERMAVFWADPGAAPDSADIARERNRALIERAVFRFSCPLREVASATKVLSRLCYETSVDERIVFVPVGPKPHILACGLAAAQFSHAAVLAPYLAAGGIGEGVPLIEAAGEIVYTRVQGVHG